MLKRVVMAFALLAALAAVTATYQPASAWPPTPIRNGR
jgi:hypothetical protein